MEEQRGYIPIFRKFFDHHFWEEDREFSKAEAWIDCIQMARYKKDKKKKLIAGNLITWGYGQFPASIRFLKKRWNWGSNGKVLRYLDLLESDNMIKIETEQGQNIITLCNYGNYDPSNIGNGTQTERRRNADGTQTERNSKKGNKGKKDNKTHTPREKLTADWSDSDLPDIPDKNEFFDFVQMTHRSEEVATVFWEHLKSNGFCVGGDKKKPLTNWRSWVSKHIAWASDIKSSIQKKKHNGSNKQTTEEFARDLAELDHLEEYDGVQ